MSRVHAIPVALAVLTLGALVGCSAAPSPAAVPAPTEDRTTAAARVYCERLESARTAQEVTDVQVSTRQQYPDLFEGLSATCPDTLAAAMQRAVSDPEMQREMQDAQRKLREQYPDLAPPTGSPSAPSGAGYPPGSPEYQTCVADPTNSICGG